MFEITRHVTKYTHIEPTIWYELPFGFTVAFHSTYVGGFKPYPVTPQRCRFIQIRRTRRPIVHKDGSFTVRPSKFCKTIYLYRIQKDF